ncbi:MAG: NAD-dependent epimerase/dehydratase family protein [Acidobacteriota bacterium]
MQRIVVTGAAGQIGTELTRALRERYGADAVLATDIRQPEALDSGPFQAVDCLRPGSVLDVLRRHRADTLFHLPALLSARSAHDPWRAWELNVGGLRLALEAVREAGAAIFVPSSIGAFGPSTPKDPTPQDTVQRPTSMYGITKVAGELLCDFYADRYGVDARGLRYPGLVSHTAPAGGGTTDWAVEIFHAAVRDGAYTCFLEPDTRLDLMYMPDATRAAIELMEADASRLAHRNAFNITAVSVTPAEMAREIRRHLPRFTIDYAVDRDVRQPIAESWPDRLDDSAAREEWGWRPAYDLAAMVADMLHHLGIGSTEAPRPTETTR